VCNISGTSTLFPELIISMSRSCQCSSTFIDPRKFL